MKKKKPAHGSALADHVHDKYMEFCKKRGIPILRFGSAKQRKGK